ncbi:MAG: S8 family serine peptidase [Flavobacteriaceae bacterium]|nr:S8 family serine peptidase [Flavobacteriaceae bacterium]
MKFNFKPLSAAALLIIASSCGSADIISTPIGNIDSTPLKEQALTEAETHKWAHMDLVTDTIPGMSVEKAYTEILNNRKGKTVVVAVIDTGIDIDHEDLKDVIWTNKKEVPNNGKDDDKNGYIDDVHGWNFLGDGYDEQLEYVRLIASGDTSNPRFNEAKAELEKETNETLAKKTRYEQMLQRITNADKAIVAHLKKDTYTKETLNAIKTEDENLKESIAVINQMLAYGFEDVAAIKKEVSNGVTYFTERLNYHFNVDFNGRKTGDDPNDFSQTTYGNGNVKHIRKDESHGTHVAGIIAATRNNGIGMNGVANHVEIMTVRTVPNGDEYDKDVALAIRYAVDNGAKVINTSFGKFYSSHPEKVIDAIIYAGENDVLIINAAGNDHVDIDKTNVYPNDVRNGSEVSEAFLTVGALAPKYGSEIVARYSNYGQVNVDIFAPGSKIYSTFPENEYKAINGTSMAAPAVAGIAALIRSQFPKLSAADVKNVILESGLPIHTKVIVGGDSNDVRAFETLSTSGKMANAYNALILASKYNKK